MSFQILRRFWCVILVLMISPITNTFSQEATATNATAEPLQEITLLIAGDIQPSEEFLRAFEDRTTVNGHTLRLITQAEAASDPEVRPLLRLTFEAESQAVAIELLVHPLREYSPILMDLPSPAIVTDSTETQAIIAAIYGLYAADDCDAAINLAQTELTQNADVTAEQGFNPLADISGFRRLLGWNCFLLREERNMDTILLRAGSPIPHPLLPELDIALTVNDAWRSSLGSEEQAFAKLDALAERWDDDLHATVEIMRKRSQLYGLVNDFDSAMDEIEQAIDFATGAFSKTELAPLYIQRGQVYTLLYEWDNAIFDYTTAIKLAPENKAVAEAYYYRGFIYYTTLFDRERALPDFERYLELDPYGEHRENAVQYRADIEAELEALSG